MSVGFHSFQSNEICCICLIPCDEPSLYAEDPNEEPDCIVHDGTDGTDGEKHPFHRKCNNVWINSRIKEDVTPNCPQCRVSYDVNSLLTWKQRTIIYIKDSMNNENTLLLIGKIGFVWNIVFLATVYLKDPEDDTSPKMLFFSACAAGLAGVLLRQADRVGGINQ